MKGGERKPMIGGDGGGGDDFMSQNILIFFSFS
jgi:hypothetical protein